MTTKLEDIEKECWAEGMECTPCTRIAATLIQAARAERDYAIEVRDKHFATAQRLRAERDAARLAARLGYAEARLRAAEADRNADIASRMEEERDEALAELQRYRDDARFSTADALKQRVRTQQAALNAALAQRDAAWKQLAALEEELAAIRAVLTR